MKKFLSIVLILCMVTSVCACGDVSSFAAPTDDVIILYTNDEHCGVNDGQGYQGLVQMKNALEAAGKTVIIVSAGDFIQGDIIGLMTKGEDIIKLMNDCGYAVAAVGNHDFDYGVEQLLALRDKAEFPFLSCNFLDRDGNTLFDSYKIIDVNGVKIAFIGITTPTTFTTSTPKFFQDDDGNFIYSFATNGDTTGNYFCNYIQNAVDEVKEAGADYVIALSHLGIYDSDGAYASKAIISKLSGIDVFLDAHSHTVMDGEQLTDKDGKSVILTQTGTKLEYIGMLKIEKDTGTITSQLIDDDGIQSEIDTMQANVDSLTEGVVAHSDFDLVINNPNNPDIRIVRTVETNLGDLLADAYRTYGNADIGLVNSGGIRKSVSAGKITYKQMIAVLPFSNNVVVIKATGQKILDALECSAMALPSESGAFLQVSGLSFTIDTSVESPVSRDGNSMFVIDETSDKRIKNVMVGNEPIKPEKEYTVAGLDYTLLNNGDGYTCFDGSEVVINVQMSYLQVFLNYVTDTLKGIIPTEYSNPYGQGRIVIK